MLCKKAAWKVGGGLGRLGRFHDEGVDEPQFTCVDSDSFGKPEGVPFPRQSMHRQEKNALRSSWTILTT